MKKEINNEVIEKQVGLGFPVELGYEKDVLKKPEHKLIVVIVKKGYAYQVIKTANENGAKGAVILDGRGVATTKKRFFGMEIAPEKEAVLIVVEEKIVYPVIKSVYAIADFKSDAKGVAFAMPISMLLD